MMAFILKAYNVAVGEHPIVRLYAKNKNQARVRAWDAYRMLSDISFKEFLKLKAHISLTVMTSDRFGDEILAGGLPAYFIEKIGNTVRCVRPNDDRIMNHHELDCELKQEAQS